MAGLNLMHRLGNLEENPGPQSDVKITMEEGGSTTGQKTSSFDDGDDPGTYMTVYQELKNSISKLDDNAREVDNHTDRLIKATSNAEEKDVITQLNKLMAENSKLSQTVKGMLKEQKLANDKFCVNKPGSSVGQWRINQLNTCTRAFQQSSNTFQSSLNRFNNELKSRQKRHIGHIDKKLTDEEIDNLISDPTRAQTYIQQSFQLVDVGDAMMDRLAEIESRTQGMQKIYDSLEELRSMWQELHFLISEQQEYLDSIENNVSQTKEYIAQATVNLTKAEKSQKASRKLQFCMMCICFILLLIILGSLGGAGVFSGT